MIVRAEEAVRRGYDKVNSIGHGTSLYVQFPTGFFRIEFLNQSIVVVDGHHLKEFFDAPKGHLSFKKWSSDSVALKHTFHENMASDHYHSIVTRKQLSRHIPKLMPGIVDKLAAAFDDEIIADDGIILYSDLT